MCDPRHAVIFLASVGRRESGHAHCATFPTASIAFCWYHFLCVTRLRVDCIHILRSGTKSRVLRAELYRINVSLPTSCLTVHFTQEDGELWSASMFLRSNVLISRATTTNQVPPSIKDAVNRLFLFALTPVLCHLRIWVFCGLGRLCSPPCPRSVSRRTIFRRRSDPRMYSGCSRP